jgi:hypothetical protein
MDTNSSGDPHHSTSNPVAAIKGLSDRRIDSSSVKTKTVGGSGSGDVSTRDLEADCRMGHLERSQTSLVICMHGDYAASRQGNTSIPVYQNLSFSVGLQLCPDNPIVGGP